MSVHPQALALLQAQPSDVQNTATAVGEIAITSTIAGVTLGAVPGAIVAIALHKSALAGAAVGTLAVGSAVAIFLASMAASPGSLP